jgi:hypothetical protein
MWQAIAEIAKKAGCKLTVYIDDVTLSGDAVPERVVWQVRQKIHSRGLIYHKEKHYTGGTGEVTGALIKDGAMQVPNRQRKKAHEARTRLAAAIDESEAAQITSVLRGLAEQRKQVERASTRR